MAAKLNEPRLAVSCTLGLCLILVFLSSGPTTTACLSQQHPSATSEGYTNTPFLPGEKWRVHDATRPHPRVVTPGTEGGPQTPGRPPSDAVVVFDGKDLSHWQTNDGGKLAPARWKVENGYMEVVPGTGSIVTKENFGDCQIHLEWATPSVVAGRGQGRGNSGVIVMGRYEIQILDSFGNVTYADGQAAAMYGQYPPLVNASRGPGEWQRYDIVFEAPRFQQGGKLVRPAYVTLFHNGVLVHNHQAFIGGVVHAAVAKYSPHPLEGPLLLQDHETPVRFRNIWVRRLGSYDEL